jgi:predicted nucleic acid-binding protein
LYRRHLLGRDHFISFMTLAELDHWAVRYNWGPARRESLDRFLQGIAVHYPDRPLCHFWAEVTDQARRKGRPIDGADAWVAASALALDVPLVTHNPADYSGVDGLTILSEAGL